MPKYSVERGEDSDEPLLETGDRAQDARHGGIVWVVDRLEETADEVVIERREYQGPVTVADYHRGDFPADDEVLRVVWEDDLEDYANKLGADLDPSTLMAFLASLEVTTVRSRFGIELKTYHYPESRLEGVE